MLRFRNSSWSIIFIPHSLVLFLSSVLCRSDRGLAPDPFKSYGLVSRPDWSHRDGTPGSLTPRQADAVVIMRQMVEDVKKALDHVNTKV